MENIEKKTPLNDLMDTTMDKIRDMVDSNTIIGEPIQTPDGVTVIPVSRVSFGFGAGGGESVSQRLTAQLGYSVPLLAQVPIDIALREGGDRGEPVAVASGPAAEVLTALGTTLASVNRGLAGRPLGVSPIRH